MAIKIGAIFELKDSFSNKLKKLEGNAAKSFKNISRSAKTLKNRLKKDFSHLGSYAFKALVLSIGLLGNYLRKSLLLYQEQNKATLALTNSLQKQKGMTSNVVKEILDYASAVQNQGVIGDEVLQAGMNELALYGLKSEQIKLLTNNIGDMLAKEKGINATMQDSVTVGKTLAKALAGRVKGLQQYGIFLSELEQTKFKEMNTEKKVLFLNEKISKSVGNLNSELRNTPEGMQKALVNDFGDMQEIVGSHLQPAITSMTKELLNNMPIIKQYLIQLIDKLSKIEPTLSKGISFGIKLVIKGVGALIDIVKILSDNWSWIKYVFYSILGLVGIIKIYNAYIKTQIFLQDILTIAKGLGVVAENATYLSILKSSGALIAQKTILITSTIATWAITAATWAFNIALIVLTSPITYIILGIAALAAGIYYLYKNFDWVKLKAIELWAIFSESTPFKLLIGWFQLLRSFIQPIIDIINKLKDGIKNLASRGLSKIGSLFGFGQNKEIPKNAMGTPYFTGGLTTVHERGGELINLPSGTQIIPHDLSNKIVNNNQKNQNINININMNGGDPNIEKQAYDVARIIARQLNLQGGNVLG